MLKSDKNFVMNVTEIYQRLRVYQLLVVGAIAANLVIGMSLGYVLLSDPIVIMENEAEMLSFTGKKREIVITEKEIKKVIEKFIRRRYEWEIFSAGDLIDKLNPIVTSGLKEKILTELNKDVETFKAISQYVGKIDVTVDRSGNILAKFDKVLRITGKVKDGVDLPGNLEKVPLLSEAQIMAKVVKGASTDENPLGIYVNSMVSYSN
jgi:hypothetical protein